MPALAFRALRRAARPRLCLAPPQIGLQGRLQPLITQAGGFFLFAIRRFLVHAPLLAQASWRVQIELATAFICV